MAFNFDGVDDRLYPASGGGWAVNPPFSYGYHAYVDTQLPAYGFYTAVQTGSADSDRYTGMSLGTYGGSPTDGPFLIRRDACTPGIISVGGLGTTYQQWYGHYSAWDTTNGLHSRRIRGSTPGSSSGSTTSCSTGTNGIFRIGNRYHTTLGEGAYYDGRIGEVSGYTIELDQAETELLTVAHPYLLAKRLNNLAMLQSLISRVNGGPYGYRGPSLTASGAAAHADHPPIFRPHHAGLLAA